ncbi:hypothetical protein [Mycobacterium phage Maco7]|nr:hypothetical protein [Mycobacterium phage Maco7]
MPTDDYDSLMSDIDSLISEDLERGERDEAHQANPDPCPHCNQMWHGLPITRRMVEMREEYLEHQQEILDGYREGEPGEIDYAHWVMPEDYSYATDDSHVFCPGSDVQGPNPPDQIWDKRHRLQYYGNEGRYRQKHYKTYRFQPPSWDEWDIAVDVTHEFAESRYPRSRFPVHTRQTMTVEHRQAFSMRELRERGVDYRQLTDGQWLLQDQSYWIPPVTSFDYTEMVVQSTDPKEPPTYFEIVTSQRILERYHWLTFIAREMPTSPVSYTATEYQKTWTLKGLAQK